MPAEAVAAAAAEFADEDQQVIAVMAALEVSRKSAARRCHDLGLVSAETRVRFEKDRRKISVLYDRIGQVPPDRDGEKGRRLIDHRLHERVAVLDETGLLDQPYRLLDLTIPVAP